MPAAGQNEGFDEHNQIGRTWSKLSVVAQETFHPTRFERLALNHYPEFCPTKPDQPINEPLDEEEEVEDTLEHIDCFERLVNLQKVKQHLESGKLGQTIAASVQAIEKRGREEIGKVAAQVRLLFIRKC